MENQRDEAYKTYMSDTAVLIISALAGKDLDMPRYSDIFKVNDEKAEETVAQRAEQIKGKFDKLRRKAE